jgi:hypothetical protein
MPKKEHFGQSSFENYLLFGFIMLRMVHSVFVVVSDDSLIRVGSVGCNYTITFGTVFCWLIVWHQHLDVLISTISNLFSNISEKILALNIQVALKH